jgi:penicillin-binding protein 1A
MAKRLGVTSEIEPLPSIALGSTEVTLLELVTAYAHLASNGAMVQPYGILKIETASGHEVYKRTPSPGGQVLNSSVVGMMNSMLSGVITSGTGRGAAIGRSAAGKTGTTSDYRDAWFIGYTPDLVAGVWVGNDNNSEMKKVTGGTLPAPIWREFMKVALADVPPHPLPTAYAYEGQRLPWQNGQEGMVLPGGRPTAPRVPEGEPDFQLGKQFWDKLFQSN